MATTVFSYIYDANIWGGSGGGSTPAYTEGYRQFLQQWLRAQRIQKVLDVGCGDWQFSRLLDWQGIDYTGIDCVPKLITSHREHFGASNIHFHVKDILQEPLESSYDVIILKDVIQHWPTADVKRVLPHLRSRCKYLLVVNCRHQQSEEQDIVLGDFRPLDHRMQPLAAFEPQLLYVFDSKEVVVIKGEL